MKKILFSLMLATATIYPTAAKEYTGKAIYLPKELSNNNFNSPDSKWSFRRMATTENIVLFWAPGFGDNIATAPDFEGHNMKVDLANLLARLEQFYHVFYTDMQFVKPGTKADKYKMMVMLDYSLDGTAYGGDYDEEIGALWIAPNRVQDERLNCIAHELGHSFQMQVNCDGEGESWGGSGFFEMASQWMLWQVNPDWQTDENYHLKAFREKTHKAFLHIDNIYHSPYILEYWSEKHGLPIIADLFRAGKRGEDPAMTYMRITGINQEQFNDEMFDAERRMINWDYPRVAAHNRQYAGDWATKMNSLGGDKWRIAPENCPENYGFNAIQLTVPTKGSKVTVDFKGEAGLKGYTSVNTDKAGWRYGFVAVDTDGNAHYSEVKSGKKGKLSYSLPADKSFKQLWLVVMGAPTMHWSNIDGPENPGDAQWPYTIKLHNTAVKQ